MNFFYYYQLTIKLKKDIIRNLKNRSCADKKLILSSCSHLCPAIVPLRITVSGKLCVSFLKVSHRSLKPLEEKGMETKTFRTQVLP